MGNVRIKGVSGRMYKFRAYPLETKFAKFGAVFFVTGRNHTPQGRIAHSRIYCGEAGNMSTTNFSDQLSASFELHHANCICILPIPEAGVRSDIEKDIHQNYVLLCAS